MWTVHGTAALAGWLAHLTGQHAQLSSGAGLAGRRLLCALPPWARRATHSSLQSRSVDLARSTMHFPYSRAALAPTATAHRHPACGVFPTCRERRTPHHPGNRLPPSQPRAGQHLRARPPRPPQWHHAAAGTCVGRWHATRSRLCTATPTAAPDDLCRSRSRSGASAHLRCLQSRPDVRHGLRQATGQVHVQYHWQFFFFGPQRDTEVHRGAAELTWTAAPSPPPPPLRTCTRTGAHTRTFAGPLSPYLICRPPSHTAYASPSPLYPTWGGGWGRRAGLK